MDNNLQRRGHCLVVGLLQTDITSLNFAVGCRPIDQASNHFTPFRNVSCDVGSICAIGNSVASRVYRVDTVLCFKTIAILGKVRERVVRCKASSCKYIG